MNFCASGFDAPSAKCILCSQLQHTAQTAQSGDWMRGFEEPDPCFCPSSHHSVSANLPSRKSNLPPLLVTISIQWDGLPVNQV